MGTLDTSVGQEVLAGEPIGQMGQNKSDLYMEIRANGQPVDPAPWLSRWNWKEYHEKNSDLLSDDFGYGLHGAGRCQG